MKTLQQKEGIMLQGYRKRRGYTRQKVCTLTGIKKGRVADIENGRRKPIKLEEIIAIHTKAYHIPLKAFMDRFPEDTIDPYEYLLELQGKRRRRRARKIKRGTVT